MSEDRLFHPDPNAFEMLALTAKNLRETLAPGLEGNKRYEALLAASAIETAIRELKNGQDHDQQTAEELRALGSDQSMSDLCESIRKGDFDSHETSLELIQFLEKITSRALRETHPDEA